MRCSACNAEMTFHDWLKEHLKQHDNPTKAALGYIANLSIGYDGYADTETQEGNAKGLCMLIDEMAEAARIGLELIEEARAQ